MMQKILKVPENNQKMKDENKIEKINEDEIKEARPKIGNILRIGDNGKLKNYVWSIWLMLGDDYNEKEGFFVYYPYEFEAMGKQVVEEGAHRFGCYVVSTSVKQIEREGLNGKITTYPNVVVQMKQVSAAR